MCLEAVRVKIKSSMARCPGLALAHCGTKAVQTPTLSTHVDLTKSLVTAASAMATTTAAMTTATSTIWSTSIGGALGCLSLVTTLTMQDGTKLKTMT